MPNEYEIEIVEINLIEGGIEVFARAWKNGVQLGFGKDGTVDIERFRIFNPPTLVDNPTGTELRNITFQDGTTRQRLLKEDPEEAAVQSLIQTVSLVGKEGTTIIPNSRGNTTSTFYSSYDAAISRLNTDATWSACRDAASGVAIDDTAAYTYYSCEHRSGTNKYEINRGLFVFDTSSIGSGQQVDSGTVSLNFTGDSNRYQTLGMVDFSGPDSGMTTADYDVVSSYTEVVTQITPSAAYLSYDDWTLNSTGKGLVNMTGNSRYALVWQYDISNTTPTGSTRNYRTYTNSDEAGTTKDPKLVIVHSAAASGPTNLKSLDTNLKANIKSINTNLIANVKSINTNV